MSEQNCLAGWQEGGYNLVYMLDLGPQDDVKHFLNRRNA